MSYNDIIYNFYGYNVIINFLSKLVEIGNKNVILFSHNINFDGYIIIDFISSLNIKFTWFIRSFNIYWIKIEYCNIEIELRCSYKLLPISLEKIGEMLNAPKKKFPYKFVNKNNLFYIGKIPDITYFNDKESYEFYMKTCLQFDLKNETIQYCNNDVIILKKFMKELFTILTKYLKNPFLNNYSFSSISYKIYMKKYNKNFIKNNNNRFVHNYIKNAYYGGRCEVFGNPIKNKIIHYFDFSGMYSQCMLQKFPVGEGLFKKSDIDQIGFHTISFKCDNYLPELPYRDKKLIFPNGEIIGTYWYEEILNAIKNKKCNILKIHSSFIYEKQDYIFEAYVKDFIEIRKKNSLYKIIGKNMVNGLYGSFALNDDNEEVILVFSEAEFNTYNNLIKIKKWSKLNNIYILQIEKNYENKKILDKIDLWDIESTKRNIAYAAIIASKARIKLNNALNLVISSKGNLYYCDTDSIFAGFDDNKLNQTMGDITWSEIYEDAIFISNKFYYLKNKNMVNKGINNNLFSFENIKEKYYNNEISIEYVNQLQIKKKNYNLLQKWINKKISLQSYDKRVFIDRHNTIPLLIK